MGQLIKELNRTLETTVLLIEHDMGIVMSISDHVDVISFGKPVASGAPADVQSNPDVIKVYLGGADEPTQHAA